MFSSGIVGQRGRLPNQNWQAVRLHYNSISERRSQNRAPVFVLRLKIRCHPFVRTRTRSRNHRRDSLRGEFSNRQGSAPWRECLPTPQAKRRSKRRARRDRSYLFPQKFASPVVNRSTREFACLLQPKMVRIELRL